MAGTGDGWEGGGPNYPSWTALSRASGELEQQSGDETEEEHSQQDSQMLRCAVSLQRPGRGGRNIIWLLLMESWHQAVAGRQRCFKCWKHIKNLIILVHIQDFFLNIHINTNWQAVHHTPSSFSSVFFPVKEAFDFCMKLNPCSIRDEMDYFTLCLHVGRPCGYLKSLPRPLWQMIKNITHVEWLP